MDQFFLERAFFYQCCNDFVWQLTNTNFAAVVIGSYGCFRFVHNMHQAVNKLPSEADETSVIAQMIQNNLQIQHK